MRCQEFREMTDSYLNDELLVETNHEVLQHLENCAACRNELAARRSLLAQIRAAVKGAPEMQINPHFAKRLQTDLRETAFRRPTVWAKIKGGAFFSSPILATSIAACLLLGVLFAGNFMRNSFSPAPENEVAQQNQTVQPTETSRPTESTGAAQFVQAAWRKMTRAAIGDHENCALDFRLKEDPITLAEAAKKYGRFNKDLDKTIIAAAREVFGGKTSARTSGGRREEIEFLEAHSCVFEGRRFAHVVLRRGKQTISVLVTDTDLPSDEEGDAFTNQSNQAFSAAGFHVKQHAVFVVSDLNETENTTLAQTLSPVVRRHILKSEAGA